MRACGERLAGASVPDVRWLGGDAAEDPETLERADLVTLGYVLGELGPADRDRVVRSLWTRSAAALAIVEPGTPAGWRRVLRARDLLLAAGAHVVAPCPHAAACPLSAPDWCHFAQRVARSRRHRLAKDGELAWEDEKYSYVAVARSRPASPAGRVLATPRTRRGLVELKLCTAAGALESRTLSRRQGDDYVRARHAAWGDALPGRSEREPGAVAGSERDAETD